MFQKPSISDYYRSVDQEIKSKVLRFSGEELIQSQDNLLIEKLLNPYRLQKIELEAEKQEIKSEKYIKGIPAHQREEFYASQGDLDFECERVIGVFPIKPNQKITYTSELDTSTRSMSWSTKSLNITPTKIQFTLEVKGYGFNYTTNEDKVADMAKQEKERVMEWIQRVNKDIENEEAKIIPQLELLLKERRKGLNLDESRISSLNAKLGKI